ncbi:MAG: macrolide-specific efflux protein rane fusion protein MacA [Verrucomicrobiota bacterium]|jgi:RND family efflux transporter MFP subunit
MNKTFKYMLIAAALGSGWYANSKNWFRSPQQASAQGHREMITAVAELRDIAMSIRVSGEVQPASQLDVKAEVGGRVKKLNVIPGDTVKAGDILLEVDDRDILTEQESAKVEIDGAKLAAIKLERNFERAKELFKQNLVSREAYDNLESELAIARNNHTRAERKLQLVEDKLSKTKVIAPGDGTVLTVPIVEGQVIVAAASVNSGTTLMTIANLSRLIVETHVNQVDVARLSVKQRVKLTAEAILDEELEAQIFFIAPGASVKNSVKGVTVQALIEKPSARMRPGMNVQMTIPVANAQDVVSVPVGAVFRGEGDGRVVYVRSGEKTERRPVKIGISNTEHAQILSGVREGEKILLAEPERTPMGAGAGPRRRSRDGV